MILETGEVGRQANGAIMASMGDTVSWMFIMQCCPGEAAEAEALVWRRMCVPHLKQ